MDFRDSEAEATFRARARAFLEEHVPEDLGDAYDESVDEERLFARTREWQRTLEAHRWAAILWPEEYGGQGLGPVEQIIWNQELSRAGLGESIFVVGIGMAGPTIIAHGSPEQKARYLPPMLRGEEIWCQLFSEPGAGSDLAALGARAVRDGDQWLVTSNGFNAKGESAFGVAIYTIFDAERITWQHRNLVVGNELREDTEPIVMVRRPPAAAAAK